MGRREKPETRVRDLIDAATRVFIAQGYRRTQMADVADAMGVAKGTPYLYVEGKEALFDLVLRAAAGPLRLEMPTALPHRRRRPEATLRELRQLLAAGGVIPSLAEALGRTRVPNVRAELEGILRELYGVLAANRTAIKLVDRCAHDYPALATVWFHEGRERALSAFTRYLQTDARRERLRPLPDAAVAARVIIETVTFWAVHRFWDPAPQKADDTVAENTVVALLLAAFVKE